MNVWGQYKVGQEIIAFIGDKSYSKDIKNFKNVDFKEIGVGLFVIDKVNIYKGIYRIGEINEIKFNIKKIDEINDTKNFYNIKFGKE